MEAILAIIKAVLPELENAIFSEVKPKILSFLSCQLIVKTNELAVVNVSKLHATFGNGLLKDDVKIGVLESEIKDINWAYDLINNYTGND